MLFLQILLQELQLWTPIFRAWKAYREAGTVGRSAGSFPRFLRGSFRELHLSREFHLRFSQGTLPSDSKRFLENFPRKFQFMPEVSSVPRKLPRTIFRFCKKNDQTFNDPINFSLHFDPRVFGVVWCCTCFSLQSHYLNILSLGMRRSGTGGQWSMLSSPLGGTWDQCSRN